MRTERSALPLPRYTRRKRLQNGSLAYFFDVPTWARKEEVAQSRTNRLAPITNWPCSAPRRFCCLRSIAG